jgi:threonine synthase
MRAEERTDESGVWKYREFVLRALPREKILSHGEGNTPLYEFPRITKECGLAHLLWKHEGYNPTGSFKDRGMTVAVSWALYRGAKALACASTGNTAASMASYAALAGVPAIVFLPEGEIALGKLAQALEYGARVVLVRGADGGSGTFDDAMALVEAAAKTFDLALMNSVNPFRLEGQKTIIWELLRQCAHRGALPDWIVVPGGNLGNTSAFGKALRELPDFWFGVKTPRLAVIQAEGSNPFYQGFLEGFKAPRRVENPQTVATAIRIGAPKNWDKAVAAIRFTNGVVEQVTDTEIMLAKSRLGKEGIGAEPASAATLAGIWKLRERGVIKGGESVAAVLTGNVLKDPAATVEYHTGHRWGTPQHPLVTISPSMDEVARIVEAVLKA